MKREIKFRAWDDINKEMVYETEPKSFFGYVLFSHDILKRFEIVMQFTGLHDENGKEIYEGDIIGHKEKDNEDNIYICEFSIEDAAFLFCSPFDGEVLENIFLYDLEIIGNIYENPNLT
jgi:uncharacterized phage protein (TIGR01671 family)